MDSGRRLPWVVVEAPAKRWGDFFALSTILSTLILSHGETDDVSFANCEPLGEWNEVRLLSFSWPPFMVSFSWSLSQEVPSCVDGRSDLSSA